MNTFKIPFLGISLLFLLYLGISISPTLDYYTGKERQNYILIQGKKYYSSDIKEHPAYKKVRKDYVSNLGNAFQSFAMEEILRLEAKEKNMTVEQLLSSSKKTPTETEIQTVYDDYKDRLQGMSLEAARPRIVDFLNSMNEQEFKQSLSLKYAVTYNFEKSEKVSVESKNNPSLGPEDAKVTIIEFSDFECPFCQRSQGINKALREKYNGKIRWVFRDFPLSFHPNAMFAHIAANCANQQGKYWEVFDLLFQNTGSLDKDSVLKLAESRNLDMKKFKECSEDSSVMAEIQKDIADGQEVGVSGTPAFFINGIMVEGAQPMESFVKIIEQELR